MGERIGRRTGCRYVVFVADTMGVSYRELSPLSRPSSGFSTTGERSIYSLVLPSARGLSDMSIIAHLGRRRAVEPVLGSQPPGFSTKFSPQTPAAHVGLLMPMYSTRPKRLRYQHPEEIL